MSTQLANTDPEQSGDVFVFDRTPATRRVYTSQWSKWTEWAEGMGFDPLPADPKNVAGYLSYRLRAGAKVSTVRTARAAISAGHRDAGHPDPTTDAGVKGLLSGSARASARPQRQVTGIIARELEPIKATATTPRTGPSGRCESQAQAQTRGRVDIALISVMRDGGDGAVVGRGGNLVGHPVGGRRQRASGNPAFPN